MTEFQSNDVNNYFIDTAGNIYMCAAYIEEPHVQLINISTLNKVICEKSDTMKKFKRLIIDPRDREENNKEEIKTNDTERKTLYRNTDK